MRIVAALISLLIRNWWKMQGYETKYEKTGFSIVKIIGSYEFICGRNIGSEGYRQ